MSGIPAGAIRFNTDSNKVEVWNGYVWGEVRLSTPNLGTNRTPSGSVHFNGATQNRLKIPASSDFAFGTGDFTVEMFVYHTDLTDQQTYFGDTYGATAGIYTYKTSNNEISLYDTSQRSLSAQNVIKLNKWHHVAWARSSGTLKAFLDGVEIDSDSYSGNFTTTQYYLGDTETNTSGEFIGFMSNVRVTKGQALYTGSFTVPAEPLTTTSQGATASNVKLLCCQSTTSATAASVTPGTLVATSAAASNFGPFIVDDQPGVRGIMMGGYHPANEYLDEINYINISSTGNTVPFGELTTSDRNHVMGGTSDKTRGLSAGGAKAPGVYTVDIEYITIASTGNAVDFGADLTQSRAGLAGVSNGTRGIFAGGYDGSQRYTDIDYVTIQSKGVAAQDFNVLKTAKTQPASICSPIRGVFAGGRDGSSYYTEINFITMGTLGKTQDFGDLSDARSMITQGITSNATRGIIMGGYRAPSYYRNISYITIPTLGSATAFGDLTNMKGNAAGVSSPTRCVQMGGVNPNYLATMDYVEIASLGNAVDFGDVHTHVTGFSAGVSNGHGGL